jgi:sec-independent protein translocase protein TatA
MMNLLALGLPGGPGEWLLIAGIALLLFGKRLPEVGRSLGRGIVEFKKGLKGIEDDVESASEARSASPTQQQLPPQQQAQYKFDPYTGKPMESGASGTASQQGPH